jgi:hypothetical protein
MGRLSLLMPTSYSLQHFVKRAEAALVPDLVNIQRWGAYNRAGAWHFKLIR